LAAFADIGGMDFGCSNEVMIAQATRLGAAIHQVRTGGENCVLLHLDADADDSLAAIEQLRNAAPEVAIIALVQAHDDRLAVEAIRRGAQDCLCTAELDERRLRRAVQLAVERKRCEAVLIRQALHDPLTDLPNRTLFLDRLRLALERSRRTGAKVALLFLDVDNFKQVNDTLGHAAGDRLLGELADRLRKVLRAVDTVARFGGDEFTLLLEDLSSDSEVELIVRRINRAAAEPILVGEATVSVEISVGVTVVSDPAISLEAVLGEADLAMYVDKADRASSGRRTSARDHARSVKPAPRTVLISGGEPSLRRSRVT
jgi:diguanylate cyclase (GGDEF)-like protein